MKTLKGGEALIDGELQTVDIAFDGQIEEIGRDLDGDEIIDCSGTIVLPGMIDAHVHFRDFNEAHKETWQTGSRAAVKGGVTTVMEMPNSDPPATTAPTVREKLRKAGGSPVNFGLFGGISPDGLEDIPRITPYVQAFKLYMGETTGGLTVSRRDLQREAFHRVAESGRLLAVHAQRMHSRSEGRDLEIALDLAFQSGVPLHLCHVRTREGVELVTDAKKDGVDVTVETCPHYLTYTKHDVREKGALLKVNPPLATEDDREFLWDGLTEGLIDIVASDHAPHTPEEKAMPFEQAPSGLPGVETTLPILLNAVHAGRISLDRLVQVFSTNPAARFAFRDKGCIDQGLPADLVVVDPHRSHRVRREEIVSQCGWSPYEGLRFKGWPFMTFVGGVLSYKGA